MNKSVAFYTLGCKVNQYDSQAMMERFVDSGYQVVEFGQPADVNVVVTCVVTATGEQKSRQILHRIRREQPSSELVAAGCLAQKDANKLKNLGVRLILGNQHRDNIVQFLDEALRNDIQLTVVEDVRRVPYEDTTVSYQQGRTRAVMKIQEGCDRFCAYCIIPHVRGGIRSRSLNHIKEESKRLVDTGYQEIVLTGIHLSSYGRDLEQERLLDAVKAAAVPGLKRLRIGSLEPVIATEEFVHELSNIPQVCPQFHLSLQSGSDSVLKRMRRRYSAQEYLDSARRLQASFPACALTTDVLVGFPGETEDEFWETYYFCQKVGFSKMHIFPFSQREGTPAATMSGQLTRAVKSQRAKTMATLDYALSKKYREQFLGTVQQVLLEQVDAGNIAEGYTPHYLFVQVQGGGVPEQISSVRINQLSDDGLVGTLLP